METRATATFGCTEIAFSGRTGIASDGWVTRTWGSDKKPPYLGGFQMLDTRNIDCENGFYGSVRAQYIEL
jgi:hypothetical protein